MNGLLEQFRREVGYLVLTVTRIEPLKPRSVLRVWSSHPDVYPLQASKALDGDDWMAVIAQRRPVVCNQPQALQAFFPADAATLQSLGCGAGINVPVFEADTLLGSVNAFHHAGWYTPGRVARAERLAADFLRSIR